MGSIGTTHAQAMHSIGGVELTVYSGGTESSGAEFGWSGATRRSLEDVVHDSDLDLVVICSPSDVHGEQAIEIARQGRHILIEKPIALTVADADHLVELQKPNHSKISMVAQRRFEPEVVALEQLIRGGHLGDIRLATAQVHWLRSEEYFLASPWRSDRTKGGGSLVNQAVHSLDLLHYLCGPVSEVTAQVATLGSTIDTEDTTVSTVKFASGGLGTISTSTATPPGFSATITLHTSKGVLELGQGEFPRWEVEGVPMPQSISTATSGSSDPTAIGLEGHIAVWHDMVSAIRNDSIPLVDAREAADTTRLIVGIYESARTGRRVSLADLT